MTDDELLHLALHGGEDGWQELHELCLTRTMAERLAKVLERSTHQEIDVAAAWANVLQELHPGLKVMLPPPTSG
jgi:hypothetical protein